MRIVGGVFGAVGTVLGVALFGSGAIAAPAWTGFYLGGHVDGSAASSPTTFEDGSTWDGLGFVGASAGAFVGFNQQLDPHWVVGVEGDATWLGLKNIEYDGTQNAFVHWMASVDARAGYLVTPQTLLYGKFGWGLIDLDVPAGSYLYPGGGAQVLNAIQAGVGVETDLSAGWKLRVEGVYTRAVQDYFNTDGTYSIALRPDVVSARLGIARAFGGAGGEAQTMPVATNWSGLYLGGQAGWSISDTREEYLAGPLSGATWDGFGGSAAAVGAFAGINMQMNSAVFGAEASASWLGLDNSQNGYIPTLNWGNVDWMAAITARAGVLINPATLFYAKAGGGAIAFTSNYPDYPGTTDHVILPAAQVGVGLEAQLSPRWTARVEGLYTMALKGLEFDTVPATQNHSFEPQLISGTVGLAYRY